MKKRFNYNIITFAVVALLIITAWFSADMVTGIKDAVKNNLLGDELSVQGFINEVDASSKKYSTRYAAVDIHSLSYLATGTRVVKKDSDTIVRMKNDYLAYDYAAISPEVIEQTAESCAELDAFCKEKDIPFMYVYAPRKPYFGDFPAGVENTARAEGEAFVAALRKNGVNTLSLAEKMIEQNMKMEDTYFVTDHHWTPEVGLWAADEVFKKLNADYGLEYNAAHTDLDSYNVKTYEDWFLGSQGKKTGSFFTPLGVDDISLITPKEKTDFTVTAGASVRKGSFEQTLIYSEKIEQKALHTLNPYAAYSGGDFAVQKIENHMQKNGKKVLVIRDSYACAVTPFMAMNLSSLHAIDLRRGLHGSAVIKSVRDYVKEYSPDVVMVLYSGLSSEGGGTKMSAHYNFN